uniref:uncharacterized protein isoform X2 n=1 Tax=Myxine glutinosa TaxID=7769 RepID=UPI00358E03A3
MLEGRALRSMEEFGAAGQFLANESSAREMARGHSLYHMWREICARSGRSSKDWNSYIVDGAQAELLPAMAVARSHSAGTSLASSALLLKDSPTQSFSGLSIPSSGLPLSQDKNKEITTETIPELSAASPPSFPSIMAGIRLGQAERDRKTGALQQPQDADGSGSQATSSCCPSDPPHRPSSSDPPTDPLDCVIAAATIAVTSGGLTTGGVNARLNSDSGSSRTGGPLSVNIVLNSSTPPPLLGLKEEASSLGADEEVQHIGVIPKEKRYKCADCGKLFRQSTDLFRHQSLHTGERPFQCVQCGKAFALARDLTRHGRTHTLERPYSCQRCGKTFRLPEDVLKHQRIHTDKKPFQCDTCGKAFLRSHELLSHQRVHTGERPYRCDKCGKNFRWSHSLVGHQRTHSADRAFACRHCGKAYKHRASLALHQKSHMTSGAPVSPIVHEIGAGTITAVSSLVPERSPSSGECSPEFGCSDPSQAQTAQIKAPTRKSNQRLQTLARTCF